ncbi:hypothetical protein ASF70_12725 [Rhizobium sp. Leaf321]|uniref:hypothetical protein n=1 Tax=Rhizobium sp. Leaf321 TaxID=1736335 RepID=UPI0007129BA4|nr:hypothetical protein [Rhizobium sp. Leaf321]KQQ72392.1 hypothetical protein ASF70_12725 [Rhizobium sp. Leaf321]
MPDIKKTFAGYVQKAVRSEIDGRPRTVTSDVLARWDVTDDTGLIIGSQNLVDASACQTNTDVTFKPPA